VHYQSPQILVSCLATFEDKLVWMRRGTEPQKGYWTMPGGFMEEGEQPEQAVARELLEETRAVILENSLELFAVGSLPEMNQVYLTYRGLLKTPYVDTSMEATEVGLFSEQTAPWREFAYPDLEEVVRHFYNDHRRGRTECIAVFTKMVNINIGIQQNQSNQT
jgi:ADP-ribose pyrophosphatase YjhB (NUDIX family)